jgi:CheY-like chemotaxis protein
MKKKLECIMLIDDNHDDNFFHEREIKKMDAACAVITKNSGLAALEYLKSQTDPHVDLIFLDINMPGMNGWEFLHEYNLMNKELQSRAINVMLTTSKNPDDREKASAFSFISDYIIKPLTKEKLKVIVDKYFN